MRKSLLCQLPRHSHHLIAFEHMIALTAEKVQDIVAFPMLALLSFRVH